MKHPKAGYGGDGSGGSGGGSLTVEELDGAPSCASVNRIVFNGISEIVTCDGSGAAYINAAPPPPLLGGALSMSGTTLHTGRESDSNVNYEFAAGFSDSYMSYDGTFNLSNAQFGEASQGVLHLYLNGVIVCEIDLGSNFVEGDRAGGQNMSNYNTGIGAYSLVNGVAAFTGALTGYGDMRILSVGPTSGIDTNRYQAGSVQIRISNGNLWRQGYNEIYLTQTGNDHGPLSTTIYKFFHDKDLFGTNDPSVNTPSLDINIPVDKWISGIKYYGAGSTFDLDVIGSYCFNDVYHISRAPLVYDDGSSNWGIPSTEISYLDAEVSGVSSPPDIGETMTVTDISISVPANQSDEDAVIRVTPRDPYGSYVSQESVSHHYMIMSFGNMSDELHEYFEDETYRFPLDTDFNVVPPSITGNWDETISLAAATAGYTNSLQVFDITEAANRNRLFHPKTNYTSYSPSGNPDYSGLSGGTNYEYVRVFRSPGVSRSNGMLHVPNIVDSDLSSGDVKIYIKVPGKTAWLSLNGDYVLGTFADNAKYPDLWQSNHSYNIGDIVRRSGQTNDAIKFKCTVSGTSGGSEPSWNVVVGGSTTDNGVTWQTVNMDGEYARINSTLHHAPDVNFTLGTYGTDVSSNYLLFVKVVFANNLSKNIFGSGNGLSITDW